MAVQTLTLTDFLLARIWDDETIARACGTTRASGTHPANVAAHIVRHDPARVLTECEAKRRIVAEHRGEPNGDFWGDSDPIDDEGTACTRCGTHGEFAVAWPCATLRALALPYVDHQDFREEWRG